MDTLKQEQQQKLIGAADTDKPYEWSYVRVFEQTVINVVSAAIIGTGAIILGSIYAAWVLLLSALHTPDGLVGILAFVLLGAVLTLLILAAVIVALFRRMRSAILRSAALAGMVIGAMVGAMLGAALGSGKVNFDKLHFDWPEATTKAQEQQKNATKAKGE